MVEMSEMTRLLRRLVWFSIAALLSIGLTVEAFYALQTRGQGRAGLDLLGVSVVLAELLAFLGILLYVIRGRLMGQARDLTRQQELLEQQAVELEMQVADMEV